jgi:hypothetical protein
LADRFWLEIPGHFPGTTLDVHQVMPNHVHGILTNENAPSMPGKLIPVSSGNPVSTIISSATNRNLTVSGNTLSIILKNGKGIR